MSDLSLDRLSIKAITVFVLTSCFLQAQSDGPTQPLNRDRVTALSKMFLRDAAELPMDVAVKTVVTDLIGEPVLGQLLEGTAWEIGISVHAHPTLSEAIGEAALAVDGRAIHI